MEASANGTRNGTSLLNLRYLEEAKRLLKVMEQLQASTVDKIFIAILCPLICVAGISGNGLVIYLLGYKTRGKRNRSELLFTILAITDLVSSIILPLMISQRYLWGDDSQDNYDMVCYSSEAVSAVTVTITQCMLILICIERHRGITAPLSPQMKRRSIAYALVFALTLALGIMVPYWIDGHLYCKYSYKLRSTRTVSPLKTDLLLTNMALLVSRDLVALVILSIFISRMVRALKKSVSNVGDNKDPERVRKIRRAKNLLLVVIVAFAICTVPDSLMFMTMYALFHSKYIFSHLEILPGILRSTLYLRLLLAMGSVVNPIIYTSMHPSFAWHRNTLLACCKLCKCKGKPKEELQLKTSRSTSGAKKGQKP